jgi:cellulose synthase (UDP-forming)
MPFIPYLKNKYHYYLRQGSGSLAACIMVIMVACCWVLLPIESPNYVHLRAQRHRLYPHLNAKRPGILDPLRYLLQTLWLLCVLPRDMRKQGRFYHHYRAGLDYFFSWFWVSIESLPGRVKQSPAEQQVSRYFSTLTPRIKQIILTVLALAAMGLAALCISQPFDYISQAIFLLFLLICALVIRRIPGRMPVLVLIAMSFTISCRYLWWRYTTTVNWYDPFSLTFGILLLAAETYSWIVLVTGYFQTVWPLERKPVPMPVNIDTWPVVDLLIPTYNEALHVVKPTLYAALGIDWPKDKLNIYLLDDGGRSEFAEFAQEIGVHYIARPTHEYAKAGNINYALQFAKGDLVAIFDCDHVPTRSFLQLTVGWFFKDPKLSMLQTPHYFFSADPFERNLGATRRTPNEGALFYGLVQDGNDLWDASFFCGSCAVLRRSALNEIGGIAVETVTEDAHTSLKMHRRGYHSAYIRIPQAAGLATDSLSAHVQQRIRWARGMVQIFRIDNPLLGKGLSFAQRLCYANSMLHFLSGIPRMIFLTAPLAYLLLHAYIIYAPAMAITLYVLPHLIHASITNSRIQGKYRHSFWSEIYETVLAWYIARPTTMALINPRAGGFNVTPKSGLKEQSFLDWRISRPYLVLMLLNIAGFVAGIWRMFYDQQNELFTILISMGWVLYNMIVLGGAIAVAFEARQLRNAHRVEVSMPAAIIDSQGHMYACTLIDYSDSGAGLQMELVSLFNPHDLATLILRRGQQEYAFPCQVSRAYGINIGVQLLNMSAQQKIDYIQCTFARADSWALREDMFPTDKPLSSFKNVVGMGIKGYARMLDLLPRSFRPLVAGGRRSIAWLRSIAPRTPL